MNNYDLFLYAYDDADFDGTPVVIADFKSPSVISEGDVIQLVANEEDYIFEVDYIRHIMYCSDGVRFHTLLVTCTAQTLTQKQLDKLRYDLPAAFYAKTKP